MRSVHHSAFQGIAILTSCHLCSGLRCHLQALPEGEAVLDSYSIYKGRAEVLWGSNGAGSALIPPRKVRVAESSPASDTAICPTSSLYVACIGRGSGSPQPFPLSHPRTRQLIQTKGAIPFMNVLRLDGVRTCRVAKTSEVRLEHKPSGLLGLLPVPAYAAQSWAQNPKLGSEHILNFFTEGEKR